VYTEKAKFDMSSVRSVPFKTSTKQALANLNQLIRRGIEFPDALWSSSSRFCVDHEILTRAYDAQFSKGH
jgi:hypothetical protein